MTVKRMDNVGIVVEDIDAAIEFFTELGLIGRTISEIGTTFSLNSDHVAASDFLTISIPIHWQRPLLEDTLEGPLLADFTLFVFAYMSVRSTHSLRHSFFISSPVAGQPKRDMATAQ